MCGCVCVERWRERKCVQVMETLQQIMNAPKISQPTVFLEVFFLRNGNKGITCVWLYRLPGMLKMLLEYLKIWKKSKVFSTRCTLFYKLDLENFIYLQKFYSRTDYSVHY